MTLKAMNKKAIENINSWSWDGSEACENIISTGLVEGVIMSDTTEKFKVAVIALYKFVIDGVRPIKRDCNSKEIVHLTRNEK